MPLDGIGSNRTRDCGDDHNFPLQIEIWYRIPSPQFCIC
jgi:hypothetical protein